MANGMALSAAASEIKHEHRMAITHARSALEHGRRAGELLTQAKSTIPHGSWLEFVERECEISVRQAQRYMRVASRWDAIQANTETGLTLGIDSALDSIAETKCDAAVAFEHHVFAESLDGDTPREKIASLPEGMLLYCPGSLDCSRWIIIRHSEIPGFFHFDKFDQASVEPISPLGVEWKMEVAGESIEYFFVRNDCDWEALAA